jgi:hypothetical protein
MSEAFKSLLLMMDLLEEVRAKKVLPIKIGPQAVCYKAFEDNLGTLELTRLPKIQRRTKHINVKYYPFHEAVALRRVMILHVPPEDQLGNLLTKNLLRDLFMWLQGLIMGW